MGWPHCTQLRGESAAPQALQNIPVAAAPHAGQVLGETEVTKGVASQ